MIPAWIAMQSVQADRDWSALLGLDADDGY
jgi:hypothetical protein